MRRCVATCVGMFALLSIAGCATISEHMYEGSPKPESEVSTIRTWGNAVLLEKVDGKPLQSPTRESHLYILPGDHDFQLHVMKIQAYHLLCGALCDAIFNKPHFVRATTLPGHTYTFRFLNDEQGNVAIEDRGEHYDPYCLEPRSYNPKDYEKGQRCYSPQ